MTHRPSPPAPRRAALPGAALLVALAPVVAAAGTLVPVSGLSPNPGGPDPTACNGALQTGWLYRHRATSACWTCTRA